MTILEYFTEEWRAGHLTRPNAALQALKANPEGFLKKYPIQNNFDSNVNGTTSAWLLNIPRREDAKTKKVTMPGRRPGTKLRTLNMHKTEAFQLANTENPPGTGHAFQVHNVAMVPGTDGPVWYALTGGPDLMLTAKMTGCTFVVRDNGGTIEATHLQPGDGLGGKDLHRDMKAAHGKAAYGQLKYDIDKRSINVIGVRKGNSWQAWAQKIEKHRLAIRSVTKIWPV